MNNKNRVTEFCKKVAWVEIIIGFVFLFLSLFVSAPMKDNLPLNVGIFIVLSGMTMFGFGAFFALLEEHSPKKNK